MNRGFAGGAMLGVAPAHLDYLQRAGVGPRPVVDCSAVPPQARALLRVASVGREDKDAPDERHPAPTGTGQRWDEATPATSRVDLLAGLHGMRVPVAFVVAGTPAGVAVQIGTWSSRPEDAPRRAAARASVVGSVLEGMYPSVTLRPVPAELPDPAALPLAGLALGLPTANPPVPGDPAGPLDRVIRAMARHHWAVQVLAYPLGDTAVADARNRLVDAWRRGAAASGNEGSPSPLGDQYAELCKAGLRGLTDAAATGGWRTAVYLLGDGASYPRLAAAWRSVFSGEQSLPEPVRVYDVPDAASWARLWGMAEAAPPVGPDGYRRPFEHQTLLSSRQLAAYLQLPRCETAGFAVRTVPTFDVEPPPEPEGPAITLGQVVQRETVLASRYRLSVKSLTRHAFVTGVTGAGKTNTIFGLLAEASAAGASFLVIEPAKAEYRALLSDPVVGRDLRVFTLGDENVSPLRLNPFEVEPGTSVQTHIDLLRSLFVASFGMWEPLPQVLERCLFEIYTDRGWDVAADTNPRLGPDPDPASRIASFPTLTDLVAKAEEIIERLGYEDKITDNIRAALVTRLGALRIGGKGAMLDTQVSTPSALLFDRPAVLELERLGDDDDKAFVMGLALLKLAKYRQGRGAQSTLRQLLVIEEAHRLLAQTPPKNAEFGGDPKTKAVTAFANLLAEVRAYGLGVVIADQVPAKLAPDVVKNTNLKVVHRIVAEDDRKAVGAAMAMTPRQITALATLSTGHESTAAVFAEGDDAPLLVRPRPAKGADVPPPDAVVREHMAGTADRAAGCAAGCPAGQAECREAAALLDRPEVRQAGDRLCATLLAVPDAADRLWHEVEAAALPYLTVRPHLDTEAVWPCLARRLAYRFANRSGAAAGWTYQATERLAGALTAAAQAGTAAEAQERLAATVAEVMARTVDPYPRCTVICGDEPCRFRHTMAPLARSSSHARGAREAMALAAPQRAETVWDSAVAAAGVAIEFPEDTRDPADPRLDAFRRAALCFAQQVVTAVPGWSPPSLLRVVDATVRTAFSPTPDEGPEPSDD